MKTGMKLMVLIVLLFATLNCTHIPKCERCEYVEGPTMIAICYHVEHPCYIEVEWTCALDYKDWKGEWRNICRPNTK
jgi:hypothetical protein